MLAPFFMKAHGYSVALAGVPLVANGIGRVCSDLLSGVMATYFSAATLAHRRAGHRPRDERRRIPVSRYDAGILVVWTLFGLTEAMFALSLRKIGFDQSAPGAPGTSPGTDGLGPGHRLYLGTASRRLRRQMAGAGRTIFALCSCRNPSV